MSGSARPSPRFDPSDIGESVEAFGSQPQAEFGRAEDQIKINFRPTIDCVNF
jgi:hypothetical protein